MTRKLKLFNRRSCLQILDEVALKTPSTVRWHMYTQAPIVLLSQDGRRVTLKFSGDNDPRHGQRVVLSLNSTEVSQQFIVEPAAPIAESPAILRDAIGSFTRIAVVVDHTVASRFMTEFCPFPE